MEPIQSAIPNAAAAFIVGLASVVFAGILADGYGIYHLNTGVFFCLAWAGGMLPALLAMRWTNRQEITSPYYDDLACMRHRYEGFGKAIDECSKGGLITIGQFNRLYALKRRIDLDSAREKALASA